MFDDFPSAFVPVTNSKSVHHNGCVYGKIHPLHRPQIVARPFKERIAIFLTDSLPDRRRRPEQTPAPGFPYDMSSVEAASHLEYVRHLRHAKKQNCYPDPERAWEVGRALSHLSGKRWLNSVVMLFVCGHYREVAGLFVGCVNAAAMDLTALTELARTLPGVVQSRLAAPAPVRDMLALREAHEWNASLAPTETYERRVWAIDELTYAAFSGAWRARNSDLADVRGADAVLSGCALIATHAQYPILDRDHHASLLISDWVGRCGRA